MNEKNLGQFKDTLIMWSKGNRKNSQFPRTSYENLPKIKTQNYDQILKNLILRILQNYERASSLHFQGDSYLFYKFFTQCLHDGLSLKMILKEKTRKQKGKNGVKNWLHPKRTLKSMKNDFEREFLTNLFPDIECEDSNLVKQNFNDWILTIFEVISSIFGKTVLPIPLKEIERFLDQIHDRDFMINFRKAEGTKNIFRSRNPVGYVEKIELLKSYFADNNITDNIDLRGMEEFKQQGMSKRLANTLGVKNHILDFNERGKGTAAAPGYVRKLMFLGETVKDTFQIILDSEGCVNLHCHSGKDRTGVMVALIQMLIGMLDKQIIAEYTRSGLNCRPDRIQDVLDYLNKNGGISGYLEDVGIGSELQNKLIKKIKE